MSSIEPVADLATIQKKAAMRLLPLIVLLYIVSYLDRANVAFAKLRMGQDLGFSEGVFGFGIGIFFIGYLLLEIPGALLVERWSARKWFTRILVTWGLISAAMAFVQTETQFYVARFALGVAEAGFFPGIIVYFTHWFTRKVRARALSGLILAVPFSMALGSPVSALLLDVDWLGLHGWQWLFIVEGLPAVVLGIVTWFALPDRPRHVAWLSDAEKTLLEQTLEAERNAQMHQQISYTEVLKLPNVWWLALGIFATNTGGYALVIWLPTMIKTLSGSSDQKTLVYSCIYYSFGLISVFVSGQSSDRTGDRKYHCMAGQLFTGVFLMLSTVPHQPFPLVMLWLCLTGLAAHFWQTPFWTLPTVTLSASAAAVAIGLINMIANLAGFVGNHAIGWLIDHGVSQRICLVFLGFCFLAGAALISLVKVPKYDEESSHKSSAPSA